MSIIQTFTVCVLFLLVLPGMAQAEQAPASDVPDEDAPPVPLHVEAVPRHEVPENLRLAHPDEVEPVVIPTALPTTYNYYIGACSGSSIIGVPGTCGTSAVDVTLGTYPTTGNDLVPAVEVVYEKTSGTNTFAVGYGSVNVGAKPTSGAGVVHAAAAFLNTAVTSTSLQCSGFIAFYMESVGTSVSQVVFNIGIMNKNNDPFTIEIDVWSQSNLNDWNYVYVDTCGGNLVVSSEVSQNLQSTFEDADVYVNVNSGAASGTFLRIHIDVIPAVFYAIKDRNLEIGSDKYTQGFHLAGSTSIDGTATGQIIANDFSAKNLNADLEDARNVWINWRSSAPFAVLAYGMTGTGDFIDVAADVKYDPTLVDIHATIDATRQSNGDIYFDNRPLLDDNDLAPGFCDTTAYTLLWECNVNHALLTT